MRHVGDPHVDAVLADSSPSAQRHDAKQHDLGEPRRVLKRTGGFALSLGCVHPVHLIDFSLVRVVKQFALATDGQCAFFFQLFVAKRYLGMWKQLDCITMSAPRPEWTLVA